MDKKIASLLGAAAALTTVSAASAAAPTQPSQLKPATNYRDLLEPIPNATALLKVDDARLTATPASGRIERVQYWEYREHRYYRPRFFFRFGPPFWFGPRPYYRRYEHHHHHHHHHAYYRDED